MSTVFVQAKALLGKEVRFIDTRFDLANPQYGIQQYKNAHIEGALYWDLEEDLSDLSIERAGRHPLPSKEAMTMLFRRSGLQLNTPIAIYDEGGQAYATRAWWMLHYAGFTNIQIVQGGFQALVEASFKVTKKVRKVVSSRVEPLWQNGLVAQEADVRAIIEGKQEKQLLDARAHERFTGEVEPMDAIAGHIPTAKNFDWAQLSHNGEFHLNDAIQQIADKEKEIVVYCGSGVTATPVYILLKEAGYKNVQLYAGSYSDWIMKGNEVEAGDSN